MDWLTWVSLSALCLGIWHEINRFPATNESFRKLQDKMENLEEENNDLQVKIQQLEDEVFTLSEEIERLKDPSYDEKLF